MATIGREQMEQRVFSLLRNTLAEHIGGHVYRSECRPHDSGKEDAVIAVGALTAGQTQKGTVKVGIFTQDIISQDGRSVPDKSRLSELEPLADSMRALLERETLGMWEFSLAPLSIAIPETKEHLLSFSFDFSINQ